MPSTPPSSPAPSLGVSVAITAIREQVDTDVATATERFAYAVGANGTPLLPLAMQAIRGGKRLRAICAWVGAATTLGMRDAGEGADDAGPLLAGAANVPGLLDLSTALECYQSSALVHDDVIDRSPTRRGEPSSHAWLSRSHSDSGGPGDAAEYGQSGAILLGNLLVATAEESLSRVAGATHPATTERLIAHYALMAGEVAQGQFRDMGAGFTPMDRGATADNVTAALDVVRVKSALYSVVRPTQMGAILAGADRALIAELAAILEPAGLAFQLRDDDLGAFGTDAVTGKPTGIDILERKRTVLLAITWNNADEATKRTLERVYASDTVTDHDVTAVVAGMERFGRAEHETLIRSLVAQSHERLSSAGLTSGAHDLLAYLVGILTERQS